MFPAALPAVAPNTPAFFDAPMIAPTGFREYDARWRFPEEINLAGLQAVGLGFATQLHEAGIRPRVALGCDFRAYSPAVKQALALGLVLGANNPLFYESDDRQIAALTPSFTRDITEDWRVTAGYALRLENEDDLAWSNTALATFSRGLSLLP